MTRWFSKAFTHSIARRLLLVGGTASAAWVGGAFVARWQTAREAGWPEKAPATDQVRESHLHRPLGSPYFASGPGRDLVVASHSRPIALLLIEWSECLYCAAQMVEWGATAQEVPSVPAYEILTRRLPTDVARFLAETEIPVPVFVDSTLRAGEEFPTFPVYLLLHKGLVQQLLTGKDRSWKFWSDVRGIVAAIEDTTSAP